MSNIIVLARCEKPGMSVRQAINTANTMTAQNLRAGINKHIILMPNKSTSKDASEGFDGRFVMVSSVENDDRKVDIKTWDREKYETAHTGTFFVYVKKNEPLPKIVECTDRDTNEKWIFETGEAAGLRNVILAVNHGFDENGIPLINLHDDKNRIVVEVTNPKMIKIIENFPTEDGYYLTDPLFGIPFGEKVRQPNPDARYLFARSMDRLNIGLLNRGATDPMYVRWIWLSSSQSYNHGVLALEQDVFVSTKNPA